ncbi:PREDICTED: retinaldehyde-binding protein 1-like isoform X2 [Nicrophorus vespilloides]|uniref:Retinaldehyde-binding protein 1-like isoform X2 n=1 Tax=Nicrophorus vespilloides TaxID=110193 RepID=A0ABM1M9L9_NICVS|nr:PREDICTED: retinaldehyde-binding protein 1-like isoform X2 [Nicrophorus vespilloides]
MDLLQYKSPMVFYTEDEIKGILDSHGIKVEQLFDYIKIIKDWLKTQPHIPLEPSDRQIAYFLLMNKFSIENTKLKLDMNYTIKGLIPDYYNKPPSHPDIQRTLKFAHWGLLPNLTKKLNRVLVWRLVNAEDLDVTLLFSSYCFLFELKTILDFNKSDEIVFDMSYFPLSVVAKFNPMDVKRILTILEKVYSNRIAAFHFVKLPTHAQSLIKLVKMFLKPKIRERMIFHDDYDTLHDYFDVDQLPKEFNGNGKSLAEIHEQTKKIIMDHEDHLTKVFSARVNEDLRPTKLTNDDLLGFYGNFKQLDFD